MELEREKEKMKIQIYRAKDNIVTQKDYRDIKDTGEICHILAEIEIIKNELLDLFKKYNNE